MKSVVKLVYMNSVKYEILNSMKINLMFAPVQKEVYSLWFLDFAWFNFADSSLTWLTIYEV